MDPSSQGEIAIQSSGQSEFPQSGQIDWANFMRATAEASISILTRLSGTGVEPLTVLVAQKAFSTFHLSIDGEKYVLEALSSLQAFRAFGDVLWFGFGVEHITRSLSKSREGLGCVAICAALGEAHSAEVSASVLSEFCNLHDLRRPLSPTIAQWKQLVKACSGCLAKSKFGQLVGELASYHDAEGIRAIQASNPKDTAAALVALAKISSGHLESVVLSGGPECAWLGAVAQWLLGLSITCETQNDAGPTYRGCYMEERAAAQVKIIYDSNSRTAPTSLPSSSAMTLKRSYRLGSISEIIRERLEANKLNPTIRLPWSNVLERTFGSQAVEQLTKNQATACSSAIGSIACIFESIALAQDDIDDKLRYHNLNHLQGSFGRGLLYSVYSCFPELPNSIFDEAVEYLGATFHHAVMEYESAIARFATACSCAAHDGRGRKRMEDSSDIQPRTKTCIVALLETIIHIARAKSAFVVADDVLHPTLAGIFGLYVKMLHLQEPNTKNRLLNNAVSPFLIAITLYSDEPGEVLIEDTTSISAFTNRGICFYLGGLVTLPDPGSAETLSQVHIVPGAIQWQSQTFWRIQDAKNEARRYPATSMQTLASIPSALKLAESFCFTKDLSVKPIVEEVENCITFSYKIFSKMGENWVPPALLAHVAQRARAQVRCSTIAKVGQCAVIPNVPAFTVVEGEGETNVTRPGTCVRIVSSETKAWCVALLNAHQEVSASYGPILRTRECLSCCIRAAARHNVSNIIYTLNSMRH